MYLELVDDRVRQRRRRIVLSWIAAAATCGYLFPWAVATTRGSAGATSIGLINLAFGWTVVGWFLALYLAGRRHRVVGVRVLEV